MDQDQHQQDCHVPPCDAMSHLGLPKVPRKEALPRHWTLLPESPSVEVGVDRIWEATHFVFHLSLDYLGIMFSDTLHVHFHFHNIDISADQVLEDYQEETDREISICY